MSSNLDENKSAETTKVNGGSAENSAGVAETGADAVDGGGDCAV